ncbi:hypothetical protein XhyaCFBP1156_12710 [Xanthomonas hyacinthi]|uniref:Uncharacterized protein n=1 Tax=Xanthomonas hyacinthi TaxID=56455 RepID=A0A2S7EV11_9XANT|nr:hypothetical protein Y886_10630 [Xanthomonas hyacinthi DSM 19077]PPU96898.1 hypothetical protein XhyaCFBP1156_12710 [Xanthomonas hyacinthi]
MAGGDCGEPSFDDIRWPQISELSLKMRGDRDLAAGRQLRNCCRKRGQIIAAAQIENFKLPELPQFLRERT